MTFVRDRLPDPASYFESEGLRLAGPARAKWRTTECRFHGGKDSMRVNVASGAWVCMSCDVKAGDVLGYQMRMHNQDFITAAKVLGAWIEDGKPQSRLKPTTLSPRAALEVLAFEATVVAVAAGNVAKGLVLSESDRQRLVVCAGRIQRIVKEFAL